MSRSKSSQRSSVTNNNINNVLDGGAIKASFDFADGLADEAFDSVNNAVDVTKNATQEALKVNADVSKHALDMYGEISEEASDTNKAVIGSALERFQEQNNKSLDALAGLQGTQASNNFKLLEGIQKTIRNDNTGGATQILDNQKVLYIGGAIVFALTLILIFYKAK